MVTVNVDMIQELQGRVESLEGEIAQLKSAVCSGGLLGWAKCLIGGDL